MRGHVLGRLLLILGLLAAASVARAEPLEDLPPVSTSPELPAIVPAGVVGVSAAELRARPMLSQDERAAMRLACEQGAQTCDPLVLLGTLERTALIRALDHHQLSVELRPDGKRVGDVYVSTLPVFGEEEQIFRWANVFHIASKDHVIAREVLLRRGERYDERKVDETQRKLRDRLFTSLAVVVPVISSEPGVVDLLVVTRDIFSLRLNSNYEFQGGDFTYLSLSLAENNFLGRRMLLAMVFVMEQATLTLGPLVINKNLLGKQLDVGARGGPIINRQTLTLEGSESAVSISKPLWSLDSRWGWAVDGGHSFATVRSFRGNELRTYDAPSTPEIEAIPYLYHQRYWSVGASVSRQLGEGRWKHRFKLGYDLTSQRPSVDDDFQGSAAARADFVADVLPRNERSGVLFGSYELFTPRYREYRDVDSYDLPEDTRLGPRAVVTLGAGLRVLASDSNFGRASLETGWVEAWGGDGLAMAAGSLSVRLEEGALVDRTIGAAARLVTPMTRAGRVVSEARFTGVFHDASNRFLYLGGDTGLRGYPINYLDGDRRVVAQTEFRGRNVRGFLGSRWGLIGFYDVGGAADVLDDLRFYQDVGIGIRALGPQLSPDVFRFDFALPLTGEHAGWPPRFTAGYQQAF